MNKLFFLITILWGFYQTSRGEVIILEGSYQGKNLYVQNPFAEGGIGFCVFEVSVNEQITTDEINSSAFEIDFSALQLTMGQKVVIKIKHKEGCKPKILNPEVLKPKSTFDVLPNSMSINKDNVLSWKTKGEQGKLPYIVEQFRWNKWVKAGEVDGNGKADINEYKIKIIPHSGENKVRVKQIDYTNNPRYSDALKFSSGLLEITFSPKKVDKEIFFSSPTLYEVYDSYGNLMKKGFGEKANLAFLSKGIYYLNFDNKTDQFIKK